MSGGERDLAAGEGGRGNRAQPDRAAPDHGDALARCDAGATQSVDGDGERLHE